jgi:hypothetical protein
VSNGVDPDTGQVTEASPGVVKSVTLGPRAVTYEGATTGSAGTEAPAIDALTVQAWLILVDMGLIGSTVSAVRGW